MGDWSGKELKSIKQRKSKNRKSTLVCMIIDKLFMKVAGLEGEERLGKLIKCSESMPV